MREGGRSGDEKRSEGEGEGSPRISSLPAVRMVTLDCSVAIGRKEGSFSIRQGGAAREGATSEGGERADG